MYLAHNLDQTQLENPDEAMDQAMDQMMAPRTFTKACPYHAVSAWQGSNYYSSWHSVMAVITWLVFIAALIAITRYFWNKGGEAK